MSAATAHTSPRWMYWTGWFLSALPVLVLLSSAIVRATQHTNAVAEIVDGYGYPEAAILRIVIAECVLVVLYLVYLVSEVLVSFGLLGAGKGVFYQRRDPLTSAPAVIE